MEKSDIDMQFESVEWVIEELDNLLGQYRACKTGYCRKRLLPRIKNLSDKMEFERKQLLKYND